MHAHARRYEAVYMKQVPAHWLRAAFSYQWDRTIVWMACPPDDAHCARANEELKNLTAAYPTILSLRGVLGASPGRRRRATRARREKNSTAAG